ncbi:MAG: iron-sulfur cluster-binding domain-containing protein, partial [Halomonadaceae bacterium]
MGQSRRFDRVREFFAGFWQRENALPIYLDFLLREVRPGWSRRVMMAKVVAITQETPTCKSYCLQPPGRWQGHSAGMHLPLAVEINGRWTRRTYSISSPPEQYRQQGTITITVKRIPGGLVSNWLFGHLRVGQWLRIGEAAGCFTLNATAAPKLLLLAAGSGITPLFAMINDPQASHRDLTLLYYCRHPGEVIFARQLEALASSRPGFRLVVVFSHREGPIDLPQLGRYCPDLAQRDVFMCGPQGFMDKAAELLQASGVTPERLFRESFGVRRPQSVPATEESPSPVVFLKTRLTVQGDGHSTLLELAEAAGLKPRHGCRAGVCHQCKCTKVSGQVVDLRDGRASGFAQEDIQACISVPRG